MFKQKSPKTKLIIIGLEIEESSVTFYTKQNKTKKNTSWSCGKNKNTECRISNK